jgi:hypothetical protein
MTPKHLTRLAVWLLRAWQQACRQLSPAMDYEWTQLRNRWETVQRSKQLLDVAIEHGLSLCLPDLKKQLANCLRCLVDSALPINTVYAQEDPPVLSLRHWLDEIKQLHDEFDGVVISKAERKIRVEIPPLTLSGVYLGAFAIEFRLKDGAPTIANFEIVALDPQPASSDSALYHPHVRDSELCAGDAKVPVRQALETGRLVDAFLLIQATLQNYNRQSAYLTLDKWYGVTCTDCSETVDPEYGYSCEGCQSTLCSHCVNCCSSCSTTYCPGCIGGCAGCGGNYCSGCLEESESSHSSYCRRCRARCDKCGALVGKEELDSETQYCPDCIEEDVELDPREEVVVHD